MKTDSLQKETQDIAISQGKLDMVQFPAIFGHEGAGIIRAIGSKVKNKRLSVGDAVVLSYNTCNSCPACLSSRRFFCHLHPQVNHNAVRLSDRSTPASLDDGTPVRSQYFGHSSFAKHSVVSEDTVIKCDYPGLEKYAPLGCGFQTGSGAIFNVVKPKPHESMVIFGMGAVGLAAVMAARYLGVKRLIAVDLSRQRLDMAAQLGATDVIDASTTHALSAIAEITDGGADYAIECAGSPKVIEDCISAVRSEGRVVSLGVPAPGSKVSLDALDFLLANKTYQGIIQGAADPHEVGLPVPLETIILFYANGNQFLPFLMKLNQQGHFPVEKLCKIYPGTALNKAVKDAISGKVCYCSTPL